jgi:thioredoxin 1
VSYACLIAFVCGSVFIMGMGSAGRNDTVIAGPQSAIEEARKADIPVFLDAGSDHCAACKNMVPVLKELERKYYGRVKVVFVNVEEHRSYARGIGVVMIPTQILFDSKGEEVDRHVGYMSIEDCDKFVAKVLN